MATQSIDSVELSAIDRVLAVTSDGDDLVVVGGVGDRPARLSYEALWDRIDVYRVSGSDGSVSVLGSYDPVAEELGPVGGVIVDGARVVVTVSVVAPDDGVWIEMLAFAGGGLDSSFSGDGVATVGHCAYDVFSLALSGDQYWSLELADGECSGVVAAAFNRAGSAVRAATEIGGGVADAAWMDSGELLLLSESLRVHQQFPPNILNEPPLVTAYTLQDQSDPIPLARGFTGFARGWGAHHGFMMRDPFRGVVGGGRGTDVASWFANPVLVKANFAPMSLSSSVPLPGPGVVTDALLLPSGLAIASVAGYDGGYSATGEFSGYVVNAANEVSGLPPHPAAPGQPQLVEPAESGCFFVVVDPANPSIVRYSSQATPVAFGASCTEATPSPEAPGSPIGLAASVDGDTVTLVWSVPVNDGGSPIEGYLVQLSGPGGVRRSTTVDATSAAFSDLAAGVWNATVASVNRLGASIPAETNFEVQAATTPSPAPPDAPSAPSSAAGYWMVDAGGEIYGFGDAADPGSVSGRAVAAASTPTGQGLWVLTEDGVVHASNGAAHHGDVDVSVLTAGETTATISVLPDGTGY
ncbi:MAG: fibronectin type III domain-containing protein, partial [Actinomycetota bacterium]